MCNTHTCTRVYTHTLSRLRKCCCTCFGSTGTKVGTIQRRLAWLQCKDDIGIHGIFHSSILNFALGGQQRWNEYSHDRLVWSGLGQSKRGKFDALEAQWTALLKDGIFEP